MIIQTDQGVVRVKPLANTKYRLQPGREQDQKLTVINESTNNAIVWDEEQSNVKSIRGIIRDIARLRARVFVWHKDAWWYEDDWYKEVYENLDLGLGDMMQRYKEGTEQ